MAQKPAHPVKTTQKTLMIVEALEADGSMRVTELADAVGLGKSVVHNHLTTLQSEGYVRKVGDEYDLSLRFLDVGTTVRRRYPLYDVARETLERLSQTTGENANLMTEERGIGVYLCQLEGDSPLDFWKRAGLRSPLNATALGKAILANLPKERVDEIVAEHGLPAETERTVTDREALDAELAQIRERGYALDDEEHVTGLRCVAAPITDPDGLAIGAISVAGPKGRIKGDRFREKLPERVMSEANVIELNMNYGE
jgi:DNA-binding IclR family transcriptional regulator